VKAAAKAEGVTLVWGGDWKGFPDGPHFELDRKVYPAGAPLTRPAPHVTEPPKSEHDRLRDAVAQLDAKPVRTPAVQGWLATLIDAVLRLFKVRK